MKLHLDANEGINIVRAYDDRGVTVNERLHTASLILAPQSVEPGWSLADVADFAESHCEQLAAHGAEIVLLGTGRRHHPVDPRFLAWFGHRGMGLEVMDSMAACRTYNILAGEERRVVAGLIIEPGGD